jgi:hypothetical protein
MRSERAQAEHVEDAVLAALAGATTWLIVT